MSPLKEALYGYREHRQEDYNWADAPPRDNESVTRANLSSHNNNRSDPDGCVIIPKGPPQPPSCVA